MDPLVTFEETLKSLARSAGADLVGITTAARLSEGPPSADAKYILPSAKSVISFAVSINRQLSQDFISKRSWRPHCENRKEIGRKLYKVGDKLVESLRLRGFEAVNVELNNTYRPEKCAADITDMTEFQPDFSHRYAALAAGIGRLGWSGNLVTQKYGALVELGSVITSADLRSDNTMPDSDHPCDKCRICSQVCPVEMIHPTESTQVTVAGMTETISKKRPNTCCWIGCTGYEGMSATGGWSNWSPYRLGHRLPENKETLDRLCRSLQKSDPQMQDPNNSFSNYREALLSTDWFYYTVCGFCRNVCLPSRRDRGESRKLILNSGTAALALDGAHVVASENAVEVPTPFGINVVVETGSPRGAKTAGKEPGQFPLDREVITYLNTLKLSEEDT